MMNKIEIIYEEWQNGIIQAEEALTQFCRQLASLKDKIEPLQEQEQALRVQISEVVEALGGRYEVEGLYQLQITNPTIRNGYDQKALDGLIRELEKENPELATRIAECRTQQSIAGSLRITRSRVKP